jgi:hypothetical protein
LTVGVQWSGGFFEVLCKGKDGWLNHSSHVAVVVPPDTSVVLATVRFEFAERCQVMEDDPNFDARLVGSVRDSTNVNELRSKGLY